MRLARLSVNTTMIGGSCSSAPAPGSSSSSLSSSLPSSFSPNSSSAGCASDESSSPSSSNSSSGSSSSLSSVRTIFQTPSRPSTRSSPNFSRNCSPIFSLVIRTGSCATDNVGNRKGTQIATRINGWKILRVGMISFRESCANEVTLASLSVPNSLSSNSGRTEKYTLP